MEKVQSWWRDSLLWAYFFGSLKNLLEQLQRERHFLWVRRRLLYGKCLILLQEFMKTISRDDIAEFFRYYRLLSKVDYRDRKGLKEIVDENLVKSLRLKSPEKLIDLYHQYSAEDCEPKWRILNLLNEIAPQVDSLIIQGKIYKILCSCDDWVCSTCEQYNAILTFRLAVLNKPEEVIDFFKEYKSVCLSYHAEKRLEEILASVDDEIYLRELFKSSQEFFHLNFQVVWRVAQLYAVSWTDAENYLKAA